MDFLIRNLGSSVPLEESNPSVHQHSHRRLWRQIFAVQVSVRHPHMGDKAGLGAQTASHRVHVLRACTRTELVCRAENFQPLVQS